MNLRLMIILVAFPAMACCQNTFQKVYDYPSDVQNFGAFLTGDGNHLMTGIADITGHKLFLSKQDCEGNLLWSKSYNASSTVGNISQRVIETDGGDYVMAGSAGSFNNYDIVVVKTDAAGNSKWKKILSGNGDDVANAVIETSDHGIVVAGKTNSFGQEAGTNYRDVYLAKLDSAGNFLWGHTFGTALNYDEAFDVVETPDKGFAMTGRYIASGAFHCMLLKTDSLGNLDYIKAYGDSNHNTTGYALLALPGGGYAITGSTTVLKGNFQAFPDEFLILTDPNGDTLWTRAWHGTSSDGSESGSSLVLTPDGGFAIGVSTFSYPTVGFVPNKNMVLRTDKNGHMQFARVYNSGGSHYTHLVKAVEGYGFLLSGFSNHYTPDFNPLLIRMDSLFQSGCNETDVTPLTVEQQPLLFIKIPPAVTATGGSASNSITENTFTLNATALCQNITDSCPAPTGIQEFVGSIPLEVYPNPAGDHVNLQFSRPVGNARIVLQAVSGKTVRSIRITAPVTGYRFRRESMAPGIYFIRVTTGDYIATGKILFR